MSKHVCLTIAAIPLVKNKYLHLDDRGIPGCYAVYIPKSLPLEIAADTALDVFHGQHGVEVLDHFVFHVFHTDSGLVLAQAENYIAYSNTDSHDVLIEKLGDKLPHIYSIKGETTLPLQFLVAADNQMEARLSAKKILADARKQLVVDRLF